MSKPTPHSPGSPEKIEVMIRRVERGERIFHPDDCATFSGEPQHSKSRLMGGRLSQEQLPHSRRMSDVKNGQS